MSKEKLRFNKNGSLDMRGRRQLRLCPFCGGEAVEGIMNIWCKECMVETQLDSNASSEELAEAWNRRVK